MVFQATSAYSRRRQWKLGTTILFGKIPIYWDPFPFRFLFSHGTFPKPFRSDISRSLSLLGSTSGELKAHISLKLVKFGSWMMVIPHQQASFEVSS